jgi:hypothetical protein
MNGQEKGAPMKKPAISWIISFAVLLAAGGLLTATATARSTAPPQNTAAPTITGQAREGSTLTAENGTWSNSPTSYAYQWQRCASDGTGCANISGATSKTYTLAAADVDHRVRVVVTATNADGSASANSAPSAIVSATGAPTNTAKPTISGTPAVGELLTANNGTWTGGASSFTYQWQRCPAGTTAACVDISGATSKTYTVRTADVGSALRVNVTARNASGSRATATSDPTAIVGSSTTTVIQTTTNTTTTTVTTGAPTISFLAARRVGAKVYARFRVCASVAGPISVVARETKNGLSGRHSFTVARCGTYSRSWTVLKLFRTGTIRVSLRATDKSGKTSRTVSRLVR